MPKWEITTSESVKGQLVERKYELEALDFAGAHNRAWHLDGVATKIVNKDDPSETYTDLSVHSWKSGAPVAQPHTASSGTHSAGTGTSPSSTGGTKP